MPVTVVREGLVRLPAIAIILVASSLASAGCGSTGPASGIDVTVLVQYSRRPVSADVARLVAAGARRTHTLQVTDGVAAWGSIDTTECQSFDAVLRCDNLGEDEDPLVSVFLTPIDSVLPSDTVFLRSIGATGTVGVLSPEGVIGAVIPLGAVDRLSEPQRFSQVEVVPIRMIPL